MENVAGIFTIDLGGQTRTMKCSFEAIENIEQKSVRRGIVRMLADIMAGDVSLSELVTIVHIGLAANKDTRLSRAEIGNLIIQEKNFGAILTVCTQFLAYAISSGKQAESHDPLGKS